MIEIVAFEVTVLQLYSKLTKVDSSILIAGKTTSLMLHDMEVPITDICTV